jgi:hypothetical protein
VEDLRAATVAHHRVSCHELLIERLEAAVDQVRIVGIERRQ